MTLLVIVTMYRRPFGIRSAAISFAILAVFSLAWFRGEHADIDGRAGQAKHRAHPGRRLRLDRSGLLRQQAVRNAEHRSARARRHEVHAELFGVHGVFADAGRVAHGQIPGPAAHHRLDSGPDAGEPKADRARLDEVFAARGNDDRQRACTRPAMRRPASASGIWAAKNITRRSMVSISTLPAPKSRTRSIIFRRTNSHAAGRSQGRVRHRSPDERSDPIHRANAKKDKPFFLYLPHFAVHLPLQAKKH